MNYREQEIVNMNYREEEIVNILYTNCQGKTGFRNIVPQELKFEETEWHPGEQWILHAFDVDKEAPRAFAIKDVRKWGAGRDSINPEKKDKCGDQNETNSRIR